MIPRVCHASVFGVIEHEAAACVGPVNLSRN